MSLAILISDRDTDVVPSKNFSVTLSAPPVFDSLCCYEICPLLLACVGVLLLAPFLNEKEELITVSVSAVHQNRGQAYGTLGSLDWQL